MVGYVKYSEEFKKANVEKYLSKSESSVSLIAREASIPPSTFRNWLDKFKNAKGGRTLKIFLLK